MVHLGVLSAGFFLIPGKNSRSINKRIGLIGLQNGLNRVPTCRSLISQGSALEGPPWRRRCHKPWIARPCWRRLRSWINSLVKAVVTVVDNDHGDKEESEQMMQTGHHPAIQSVPLGGKRSLAQTLPCWHRWWSMPCRAVNAPLPCPLLVRSIYPARGHKWIVLTYLVYTARYE